MLDLQPMIDGGLKWAEFLRRQGSPGGALSPGLTMALAIALGAVLCLWGARLLRTIYVLVFMGAGAMIGIRLAGKMDVDLLIGLVLGAGFLALIGHLLFRMWIGLTAALCAMLVAAAMGGAPRMLQDIESFRQEFDTLQQHWPSVAPFAGAAAPNSNVKALEQVGGNAKAAWIAWATQLWEERRSDMWRLGVLVGLAGLLGLAMGVILPRFTTIVGTSLIGVLAVSGGVSSLLARYLPAIWACVVGHGDWFLGGCGLVLLASLGFQACHRPKRKAVPPPSGVAPAAPAAA